jgi:hypothetical protein
MAELLAAENFAAAGGAVTSSLSNRSADGIWRRFLDILVGFLFAVYLGPVFVERCPGASEKLAHGIIFLSGFFGAIIANMLYDRAKNGNLWDWMKAVFEKSKPIAILLALILTADVASAQPPIPFPMLMPPATSIGEKIRVRIVSIFHWFTPRQKRDERAIDAP